MTATRIGINGFGRMGRLALRAAWEWPDFDFAHINELEGDAAIAAHLLTFDSVHGRWDRDITGDAQTLRIDGTSISFGSEASSGEVAWQEHGVDVVIEASGKFRTMKSLAPYFDRGVKKVVVAAPVKEPTRAERHHGRQRRPL